jgi:hypothetical protein
VGRGPWNNWRDIEFDIINRRIMSSKKKGDLTGILDDLRNEDAKKRLAAVLDIKEVAAALGPAKVRGELIPFLACTSSTT